MMTVQSTVVPHPGNSNSMRYSAIAHWYRILFITAVVAACISLPCRLSARAWWCLSA